MSRKNYTFTSESVSEGHPDKVCDRISDAVLDAFLTEEPEARVAAETFATTNRVVIGGEVGLSNKDKLDEYLGKIDGIAVPDQEVCLGNTSGKLAVVGWGSTFGPIHQAVGRARAKGCDVAQIHVRHIWPLPANLGELLRGYDHVLVPEMNTGQFKTVLRDQLLVDAESLTKTSGQPFQIAELETAICAYFDDIEGNEGGEVAPNEQQLPSPVESE